MRVIITGGTGLIGRSLAGVLVDAGHDVVVLTRSPGKTDAPAEISYVAWDGRSADGWGPLVDGAGAVVHLAGASIAEGRWTAARRQVIERSRLDSGAAVVAAIRAAQRKPDVLIQASGVGYYGPLGDETVTEKAPAGRDYLARLAVDWENSTAAVESLGVRRCVIRTGVVLSTKGGALPRMMLPFRFFVGGPLGSGRQWFPWIHMEDEVGAIRFLLEHPHAKGVFNLSAPAPVRNAEFGRALGKAMGRPALLPLPAFALRLLFGEMATALLDGQRAMPQALSELGYRFRHPAVEPALRDLIARGF